MTRIARTNVLILGLATAILILTGANNTFAFQEKISPLSDYQYKRDFAQYETIKKEADNQKRTDALLDFIKTRPISRILLYAATDYLTAVKPHMDQKDWAKALSMQEALWAALPTPESVQAAGIPAGTEEFLKDQLVPTQKLVLSNMLQVYLQSNNMPKAAETTEKLYAIAPDKALLPVMANIYLGMKNYDKFLEYGQKILAETSMEQGYTLALQMAQVYLQKNDVPNAIALLTKVMDVYGDKMPPNVQEPQWNATRAFAYGVMASQVYATKDYAKSLELYEKVIKFDPKREDAYYYTGMCKWQNKDPEGAIEAFAKAVVLNKDLGKKAQTYLEDLYKARHGGSLDGLDQVLAKAKAGLGL